jgi:haloalkane dehalogenase
MSPSAGAARGASADSTSNVTMRDQMHGARYGEVLLVTGQLNRIEATVYNTLGLNDCPEDLWRALDPDAIKRHFRARAVVLNGPRYFLMDKVSIANPGNEVVDFGGLQMRPLATVPLKLTSVLGGIHRHPYSEQPVLRTTMYVYNAGREVYELVAPDGTTYVMQSYSLQINPNLIETDLSTLGDRLDLPAGWSYRVLRLDKEWALGVDGEARVLQDELENSYQRVNSSPEDEASH